MVLVNIVKGIFMLMFCLGYSLALLGAAKLLESLVHRLETSQVGRKLSFNSWKKMLDSDSENVFCKLFILVCMFLNMSPSKCMY